MSVEACGLSDVSTYVVVLSGSRRRRSCAYERELPVLVVFNARDSSLRAVPSNQIPCNRDKATECESHAEQRQET